MDFDNMRATRGAVIHPVALVLILLAAGCVATPPAEDGLAPGSASGAPADVVAPTQNATAPEASSANETAAPDPIADTFHRSASHDCITDGVQFPVGLDRASYHLPAGWVPEDRSQAARAVTGLPVPDAGQGSVTLAAWTCRSHGFAGGPANLSSVMTWVKPPVFEGRQTPEASIHLFLSEIATSNESIRAFYERIGVRVTEASVTREATDLNVRDVVAAADGSALYTLEIQPVTSANAVTSIVWVSNEHGTGYVFQSVRPPEFGRATCSIAPGSHASYLVSGSSCPPDTIGGILDAAYENEFHWYRGLHPVGTR